MKTLLQLFIISTFCLSLNAQVFWERKALTLSAGRRVESIAFLDASNVWISAKFNGAVPAGNPQVQEWGRSSDGGITWSKGNINLGNVNLGIGNLCAVSPQIAYVSAFDAVAQGGPAGGIWKTADGGLTWNKQTSALFNQAGSFADFVYFWNVNDGVAVGDSVGGYFEIYNTVDGGTNWTRLASSNMPSQTDPLEAALTDGYTVVGNTMWFGTNNGRMYKSTNKGLTWTAAPTPYPSVSTASFTARYAFENQNDGLITGNDFSYHKTTDGGLTWIDLSATVAGTLRSGSITSVPGSPGTYVMDGADLDAGTSGSSYTNDGGLNWNDINTLGDLYVPVLTDNLKFFSPTVGLAGGICVDATIGGILRYVGNFLPNKTFSSDKLFSVSPNPTNGSMKLTGVNINQVQITDILGKVISNNSYYSLSNIDLNISEFNSGIYLVKVTNNEGQTSVVKVVKQ
jgi:photosystem II stability/assembly factor-like uncharacterized protein